MPQSSSAALFKPHEKSTFVINFEDGSFNLYLDKVEISKNQMEGYESFSLYFFSEGEICLPQGTYSLEHPVLERKDIFIVPIRENEKGFEYQAVFNVTAEKNC